MFHPKRIRSYSRYTVQLLILVSTLIAGKQTVCAQESDGFTDYFFGTTSTQAPESKAKEQAYEKLYDSIETMTPDEIAKALSVIDRKLDEPPDIQNPYPRRAAASFLVLIASRPDGSELLRSQMSRLTAMIKGKDEAYGVLALKAFHQLSIMGSPQIPPILEKALEDPEVNQSAVGGAGIAAFLLWDAKDKKEATLRVVRYMQRPELTDTQMVAVVHAIMQTAYMTPALVEELIHLLDRPDDVVKAATLALIEKGGPAAKEPARFRVQELANDPRQTPEIRQSASAVLNK